MSAQLTCEGTQDRTAKPVTPPRRERLREAFRRIHQTIREMNYASRRVVELHAPWIVDQQRDHR
jgi:hypothetical protein